VLSFFSEPFERSILVRFFCKRFDGVHEISSEKKKSPPASMIAIFAVALDEGMMQHAGRA
jgi:hypothetical protein